MPAPTTQTPSEPIIPLPSLFANSSVPLHLHYQGAEALIYRTYFLSPPPVADSTSTTTSPPSLPAALKHRPSKPYRHPTLDAKLTRHRILAEARVLVKLRREGLANVPAVYALDWENGWMMMEWIAGQTVRAVLDAELGGYLQRGGEGQELEDLMRDIGTAVGRMHEVGVCHGDLTTSNLILRPRDDAGSENGAAATRSPLGGEVVLIDFGLAAQSVQDEDRAVDLYVLERAFGSTHPQTEKLWQEVLKSYGESYKAAKITLKRLEEVRMRGRKKIMIG